MAGHDDPGSLRALPPDFVAALAGGIKGMKVGWSVDLGFAAVEPEIAAAVREAAKTFAALGADVVEADLKLDPPPYEYWWTIWIANRRTAYGHIVDEHLEDVTPYVAAIDRYGARVTAADYSRALRQADRLRDTLAGYFEKFELLLLPTAAVTAYPHRKPPSTIAGKSLPDVRGGLSFGTIPFTMPFNVGGNPAASVPAGFDKQGLPIGIQIVAHLGNEAAVLRASAAFEDARPWAGKRPPLS
jgi:aspartyl-tRNA(Asn)/glutamyl-tRNA(Gln) amidotransferase subunit A